ncbi:ABC transporter ATP-binding protein [Dokdonia sp. Hel_I_53]|uniref:ABC transporter ATP-binding protein n=1 Tax=Dokdonia sp. Hel_I_53 TaxID=1566287 RepID=UPI00119C8C08|nr:ABC transporter ATP-binding protein [Dokdonia sp. Hel_I_53]TVZ51023.1 iron complex transport system ATP-binding protein [Dokdonia sp. Hel_I_53]
MKKSTLHSTLTTKGLSVGYVTKKSQSRILDNISFDLKKSTLTGLIGINGSGKSTLLRTLSGLQPPLAGTIFLNQKPLTTLDNLTVAKKISVVLTQENTSKNLSVSELVGLGRQPYTNWIGTLNKVDLTHIKEALHVTETYTIRHKKCSELSDGQLQRVLIARALAQDTDVMLLDEPLSHLDLHHKASLLKLLASIAHDQNKTVLFSTHDIEYAIERCDSLIVLHKEGVFMDSPENLIKTDIFSSLFPSKHITFNTVQKRFDLE